MRNVFSSVDSFTMPYLGAVGQTSVTYQVKQNRGKLAALSFSNLGNPVDDSISVKIDGVEIWKGNGGPNFLSSLYIYPGENPNIITCNANENSVLEITYYQSTTISGEISIYAFYSDKDIFKYRYIDTFTLFNDGVGGTTTQEYSAKQKKGKLSKIFINAGGGAAPTEILIYVNGVKVWDANTQLLGNVGPSFFLLNGIDVNQPESSSVNVSVTRNAGAPVRFVIGYAYE